MGEVRSAWLAEAGESRGRSALHGRRTEQQDALYREFRAFTAANVAPFAAQWDREQRLPHPVLALLGSAGYLGASLPQAYGGRGWDMVSFGLLNEALGRGSSALTDVLTCQAMVSMALLKWGTREQKQSWLPPLAAGKTIAAFAMTEPGAVSD